MVGRSPIFLKSELWTVTENSSEYDYESLVSSRKDANPIEKLLSDRPDIVTWLIPMRYLQEIRKCREDEFYIEENIHSGITKCT
ncbi:Protein of unknown function, partial [Gryllus bimaculatus]